MSSSTGTRAQHAIRATAKAVSVAIGTPQPVDQAPAGMMGEIDQRRQRPCRRWRLRSAAPPRAAGEMADSESRLISSPTTRKKIVSSPSFTQSTSDIGSGRPTPNRARCARRPRIAASGEFVRARPRGAGEQQQKPAEGAQAAKVSAAMRTRCPSVPSMASERSSHPRAHRSAPIDKKVGVILHATRQGAALVGIDAFARLLGSTSGAGGTSTPSTPGRRPQDHPRSSAPSGSSALTCAPQKSSGSRARSASSAARRAMSPLSISGRCRKT